MYKYYLKYLFADSCASITLSHQASNSDPSSYQIRVTNGWWDTQWLGKDNDIAPWNMAERIIDNEDGTFYIEVDFADDPIVGTLDEKNLLFIGSGFTPIKLFFRE